MEYETVIGLETHVQLFTKSKMWCRCSADYSAAPPNTHVCPVCLGLPGVLPVMNQRAVAFTIMTGLALGCTIASYTRFDRKNYPYPDLMKGYQISQYDNPVARGGRLEIEAEDTRLAVGITRVHLEEDVAKLVHVAPAFEAAYSLVDVNRSGTPLMEIVSEPDMRTAEQARQYLMKLRSILQYLGVSTANMEEGSFRCDANISIRPAGTRELGPKVEVKNMNSFKAVFLALEYEAKRQRQATAKGERIIQETRGWDDVKGETFAQRSKEYAHDYRYFPEPDLPPLNISETWVAEIRAKLPELPEKRRERYVAAHGLTPYEASLITASKGLADYYEAALATEAVQTLPAERRTKEVAHWLVGEAARIMNEANSEIADFRKKVSPENLGGLIVAARSTVNNLTAKTVLEEMFQTGKSAGVIIKEKGFGQLGESAEFDQIITRVIAANNQAVADYRAGKETAVRFLVGQVMRATKGQADPKITTGRLIQKLKEI
jgi:aspartyl-tRNA(Asn)/glutamyl-tRNA(Gln) amidotransferase subunit B